MGHVGYTGAEDARVWAGMVGGNWEGEGKEESREENPPPRPNHQPPKPQPPKLVARKSPKCIFSRMTHQMETSRPPKKNPPHPSPPKASKASPAPRRIPPQRGRGDGADDPVVGTKVHVPYSCGGGHRARKAGVVWVEYPSNAMLYQVARSLLFPTTEATHEHLECNRKGKKAPPPPRLRASRTRGLTP